MSEACQKPKVKFLECVLTSKCYGETKSFEKCIKKWKQDFDDGDPDPPCYHERRIYWLCLHGQVCLLVCFVKCHISRGV